MLPYFAIGTYLWMSPTVGRHPTMVCGHIAFFLYLGHTILVTPLLLRSYQVQDTCDMNVLGWINHILGKDNWQTIFYRAQPLLIEKPWLWQLFININELCKSRPESESYSRISLLQTSLIFFFFQFTKCS